MSYPRKSFSGNAVPTALTTGISSSDLTMQVGSVSGFPNTAVGPFVLTIDRGTASEEKVVISSYVGTTLTVNQRGADGTTAVSHTSGADVRHTLDAGTISNHEASISAIGTVTPSSSAVGDAAADGTSAIAAAADHRHAREPFATGATTSSAPGDTAADGTSASPAHADHKHARESVATLATDVLNAQFSAIGQIPVGTGNGSGTLLAPGSTPGQALRSTGAAAAPAYEDAPTVAGTLGSDYATTTSFVTFLTTASLAAGKWRVTFNGFWAPGPGGGADVKIAVGTATATFTGPVVTGMVAEAPITFTTIVTVTAAGTLVFQAEGNAGGGTIKAASPATATAGITGYTAVQL